MDWWWGAIGVVVVGAAVVFYGWWSDRRRHRDAAAAERRPTREIPGLGRKDAPAYVTEQDIAALAAAQSQQSGDDPDPATRLDEAATLPGGAAEGSFLNRADKGLAVLDHPQVLVLGGDLMSDRDTTTLLAAAKSRNAPLVIVAPYFADRVLATLRANTLAGKQRTLPIPLEDETARRRAVALTGARLLPPEDLQAGFLPPESWGTCDAWIADLDDSWILVTGRDTPSHLS